MAESCSSNARKPVERSSTVGMVEQPPTKLLRSKDDKDTAAAKAKVTAENDELGDDEAAEKQNRGHAAEKEPKKEVKKEAAAQQTKAAEDVRLEITLQLEVTLQLKRPASATQLLQQPTQKRPKEAPAGTSTDSTIPAETQSDRSKERSQKKVMTEAGEALAAEKKAPVKKQAAAMKDGSKERPAEKKTPAKKAPAKNASTQQKEARPASTRAKPNSTISAGTPKRRYPVTYLLVHRDASKPDRPTNADRIFFYSSKKNKGGPVWFLSNFATSHFRDVHMHLSLVFHSVEQYYQLAKAKHFMHAPVVYNDWETPVPSNEMWHIITTLRFNTDIATTGRSYDNQSEEWKATWQEGWHGIVAFVLRRAVYLKFAQNPHLVELLLKTGEHELIEASAADHACGIGYRAADALANIDKWGDNLLGKALMGVRSYFRKKLQYTGGFDQQWWDDEVAEADRRSNEYYEMMMGITKPKINI